MEPPTISNGERTPALIVLLAPPRGEDGFAGHAIAISRLISWLADGGSSSGRGRLLLNHLRADPAAAEVLSQRLQAFLTAGDLSRLFCDAGLPPRSMLVEEILRRMIHRLLPPPISDRDPTALLSRLAGHRTTARWMESLHPMWVAELMALLPGTAPAWASVPRDIADAMEVIAIRMVARSEEPELRYRAGNPELIDSPFQKLLQAVSATAVAIRHGTQAPLALASIEQHVAACRVALKEIHDYLERNGVRVDVVFWVSRMRQQLARLVTLASLIEPDCPIEEQRRRAIDFIKVVAADERRKRLLGTLLLDNYSMLSGRIVENSRHTGGHYITSTAREWGSMGISAGGGGVITAGAVAMKVFIAWAALPIAEEWFVQSMNYSGGFLIMQLFGFTLATKQPPMTAAALAEALEEGRHQQDITPFATLCARIVRSQLAAVIGNLALVACTGVAIDLLWRKLTGHHLVSSTNAIAAINSFNPIGSGSLIYAAITGVALWLSSIIAGYGDNMANYHRLPKAVEQSPILIRAFGEARTKRISLGLSRNIGGICNNVALGVMLATVPAIGVLVGIPLAMRHITFVTGTLTFAWCAVGMHSGTHHETLLAFIGIGCIGLLNFGVGFTLSLLMAMRARDIRLKECARMMGRLVRYFITHPFHFLVPLRD